MFIMFISEIEQGMIYEGCASDPDLDRKNIY